jgi:hypothetical protein
MNITFNRTFTQREFNRGDVLSGSSIASMLLGAPSGGSVDTNVLPDFLWTFVAPWIQDDWRLSDKLTVNLGVRWDFNSPVSEVDDRLNYIFDPGIVNPVSSRVNLPGGVHGGLTFVGVDGNPSTPYKTDRNNIQFRAGTAYQLNQRTVLRGGYGRYYLNATNQGQQQGFSISTPLISSNDSNRTPLYNLANPFPNGVIQPPGSALGAQTFLGRGLSYSNPNFQIPYVDQFSIGLQRELPGGVTAEITYAASRSRKQQSEFRGINEPPLSLVNQCDVTLGGNRGYCDQQLPNPFYQVPGFEGTNRFTSPTLSRFELSRPYPAFGGITEQLRNDGKIDYDSVQFVGNKRWARGFTLNANYTWVPRYHQIGAAEGWTQSAPEDGALNAFIDPITAQLHDGPYWSHRLHRFASSGVWEFPFGRGRSGVLGGLLKGWSVAPMFVFQSGQPWRLPNNVELIGDPSLPVKKDGQFIYGMKPCVAQRNNTTGQYQLIASSVAYGCTEPFFLIREPYKRRTTPFVVEELRRPNYWQLDLNFAKTTQIASRVRFQVRLEAFNVFNSPMYDERDYNRDTNSADFGRINRNSTNQSNFQRFVQLGFRLTF